MTLTKEISCIILEFGKLSGENVVYFKDEDEVQEFIDELQIKLNRARKEKAHNEWKFEI